MAYTQENRKLSVDTPLGKDVVLLVGLNAREAISQLFSFRLDLVAENRTNVAFDKVLGQKVTAHIELPDGGGKRHMNGVCIRMSQAERGKQGQEMGFTSYRMELVPQFWLLTRKTQSRIFQQLTVPQILKKVLTGLTVSYELQGKYEPRDYCVQYRETDYAFASRLMEEEGIYYFFKHDEGDHTMVLSDNPTSHPGVPGPASLIYEEVEGGKRDEDRVRAWMKTQELRSGKITLWDHCFELPHKHLEAEKTILDSVPVGSVTHKLKIGDNTKLELYDFPGEYAQRFDGVDKGGGDRPADLQKIFVDNQRTTGIRMEQEEMPSILIQGESNVRHLVPGHKFDLTRHFNANGSYLLVSVQHACHNAVNYGSGEEEPFAYENAFTCIPDALGYRPPRTTPRPTVKGSQTALVVGPPGEEIFTDKYGRVKVQFHWDRDGKFDVDSSCWIRVATHWAGKKWGMISIPRITQEVVVDFLEGDPDQPIIVGSVYNAREMPPYELPANKTQSGVKTRSSLKGTDQNFNELRFEDLKGSEDVYFHAEKDMHRVVEHDDDLKVGNDQTILIKGNRGEQVDKDEKVLIQGKRLHDVEGDDGLWVAGQKGRAIRIENGNHILTIDKGDCVLEVKMGDMNTTVDMGNISTKASMGNIETKASLGSMTGEALQSIELKVGMSSIKVDQMGVTIKGMKVSVEGQVMTEVKGMMTTVDGDAMLKLHGGITMIG